MINQGQAIKVIFIRRNFAKNVLNVTVLSLSRSFPPYSYTVGGVLIDS
jgi:hypothetical protein